MAQKTRRAVRDAVISTQEKRTRQRRNLGFAILGFVFMLVLLAPAIWNGMEDLLGEEHLFDLPTQIAFLIADAFSCYAGSARSLCGKDNVTCSTIGRGFETFPSDRKMINPSHNAQSTSSFTEEVKLIPRWSIAARFPGVRLHAVPVLGDPACLPAPSICRPIAAPLASAFTFALSWSTLAALYVLMVGYVSRDAPRRSMSTRLWVVICLALPGGIGSVLYFLLRQPVVARCPSCGTSIHTEFHFCPQCAYQVSAACGNCYRGVRITDVYCVYCGHSLAADNMPSRLRAFQS